MCGRSSITMAPGAVRATASAAASRVVQPGTGLRGGGLAGAGGGSALADHQQPFVPPGRRAAAAAAAAEPAPAPEPEPVVVARASSGSGGGSSSTSGSPVLEWIAEDTYRPSENVGPGWATPVLRLNSEGEPVLHTMKWGLVPSFAKQLKAGEKHDHFRLSNARARTVDGDVPAEHGGQEADDYKRVFKGLLRRKHCVVPVDGWYEWLDTPDPGKPNTTFKQPYFIRLASGEPLLLAGLYDVWRDKSARVEPDEAAEGDEENRLYSYTLLTTASSKKMQWLHHRMPCVLPSAEDAAAWLDACHPRRAEGSEPALSHSGYGQDDLVWHPVSRKMSKLGYQEAGCSSAVKVKTAPTLTSFFSAAPAKAAAAPADEGFVTASSLVAGGKGKASSGGGGAASTAHSGDEALARKLQAAEEAADSISSAAGGRSAGRPRLAKRKVRGPLDAFFGGAAKKK